MFFNSSTSVVDIVIRSFLIVMPIIQLGEWIRRFLERMSKGARHRKKIGGELLGIVGAMAQCYLVAKITLNGLNGSLIGFFVVLVFGTHLESLIRTYDVRGAVANVLNYVIFILQ